MRIVFMGTPQFSVPALEELIGSKNELVAVLTQPDKPEGRGRTLTQSPVKLKAQEHGIKVLQPGSLRNADEVERLADLKPEVIVVSAFGQILPRSVLDIPEYGCLNIHPSLLPLYRGATPIPTAILSGDDKTGVTIMLLDEGMDTGPILTQYEVGINPDDTTGSLTSKLAQAGACLLVETLQPWCDRTLTPQPQDESKASYTYPISKKDGAIDWQMSVSEICRMIRAFYPWPGSYTLWQGRTLKIIGAVPLHKDGITAPGRVVSLPLGSPVALGVETGNGILGLVDIQLEGKKIMKADEFLRGQPGLAESVLGK